MSIVNTTLKSSGSIGYELVLQKASLPKPEFYWYKTELFKINTEELSGRWIGQLESLESLNKPSNKIRKQNFIRWRPKYSMIKNVIKNKEFKQILIKRKNNYFKLLKKFNNLEDTHNNLCDYYYNLNSKNEKLKSNNEKLASYNEELEEDLKYEKKSHNMWYKSWSRVSDENKELKEFGIENRILKVLLIISILITIFQLILREFNC